MNQRWLVVPHVGRHQLAGIEVFEAIEPVGRALPASRSDELSRSLHEALAPAPPTTLVEGTLDLPPPTNSRGPDTAAWRSGQRRGK